MDLYPSVWQQIADLIESRRAISPDEVLHELKSKSDEVYDWCRIRNGETPFFLPLEEHVQLATAEILEAFPKLVDDRPGKGQADPFVIGLARVKGATVVTEERKTGSNKRPKIPEACHHFGVGCIDLVAMMRAENWRF